MPEPVVDLPIHVTLSSNLAQFTADLQKFGAAAKSGTEIRSPMTGAAASVKEITDVVNRLYAEIRQAERAYKQLLSTQPQSSAAAQWQEELRTLQALKRELVTTTRERRRTAEGNVPRPQTPEARETAPLPTRPSYLVRDAAQREAAQQAAAREVTRIQRAGAEKVRREERAAAIEHEAALRRDMARVAASRAEQNRLASAQRRLNIGAETPADRFNLAQEQLEKARRTREISGHVRAGTDVGAVAEENVDIQRQRIAQQRANLAATTGADRQQAALAASDQRLADAQQKLANLAALRTEQGQRVLASETELAAGEARQAAQQRLAGFAAETPVDRARLAAVQLGEAARQRDIAGRVRGGTDVDALARENADIQRQRIAQQRANLAATTGADRQQAALASSEQRLADAQQKLANLAANRTETGQRVLAAEVELAAAEARQAASKRLAGLAAETPDDRARLAQVRLGETARERDIGGRVRAGTDVGAVAEEHAAVQRQQVAQERANLSAITSRDREQQALAGTEARLNEAEQKLANISALRSETGQRTVASEAQLARETAELQAQQARLAAADDKLIAATAAEANARELAAAKIKLARTTGESTSGLSDKEVLARSAVAERTDAERRRTAVLQQTTKADIDAAAERKLQEARVRVQVQQRERELIKQAVDNRQVGQGTFFQRLQSRLNPRAAKLPEEQPTLKEFAGEKFQRTVGFAVSGAVLGGTIAAISEMVRDASELEVTFIRLKGQMEGIGRTDAFGAVRDDIRVIAAETGQASTAVAGFAERMLGLSHDPAKAMEDTASAMKLMTVTGLDQKTMLTSMVPIQKAYGVSIEEIGDKVVEMGEKFGISEADFTQFLGKTAVVAKSAGMSFDELAILGGNLANSLGKPIDSASEAIQKQFVLIENNKEKIFGILQSNPATQSAIEPMIDAFAAGSTSDAYFELLKASQSFTQSQKNAMLTSVVSRREAEEFNATMANAGPILQQRAELQDRASRSSGKLEERFGSLKDTVTVTAARIAATFESLGEALFRSGVSEVITDIGNALQIVVGGIGGILQVTAAINSIPGFGGITTTLMKMAITATIAKKVFDLLAASRRGDADAAKDETASTQTTTTSQVQNTESATADAASEERLAGARAMSSAAAKDEAAVLALGPGRRAATEAAAAARAAAAAEAAAAAGTIRAGSGIRALGPGPAFPPIPLGPGPASPPIPLGPGTLTARDRLGQQLLLEARERPPRPSLGVRGITDEGRAPGELRALILEERALAQARQMQLATTRALADAQRAAFAGAALPVPARDRFGQQLLLNEAPPPPLPPRPSVGVRGITDLGRAPGELRALILEERALAAARQEQLATTGALAQATALEARQRQALAGQAAIGPALGAGAAAGGAGQLLLGPGRPPPLQLPAGPPLPLLGAGARNAALDVREVAQVRAVNEIEATGAALRSLPPPPVGAAGGFFSRLRTAAGGRFGGYAARRTRFEEQFAAQREAGTFKPPGFTTRALAGGETKLFRNARADAATGGQSALTGGWMAAIALAGAAAVKSSYDAQQAEIQPAVAKLKADLAKKDKEALRSAAAQHSGWMETLSAEFFDTKPAERYAQDEIRYQETTGAGTLFQGRDIVPPAPRKELDDTKDHIATTRRGVNTQIARRLGDEQKSKIKNLLAGSREGRTLAQGAGFDVKKVPTGPELPNWTLLFAPQLKGAQLLADKLPARVEGDVGNVDKLMGSLEGATGETADQVRDIVNKWKESGDNKDIQSLSDELQKQGHIVAATELAGGVEPYLNGLATVNGVAIDSMDSLRSKLAAGKITQAEFLSKSEQSQSSLRMEATRYHGLDQEKAEGVLNSATKEADDMIARAVQSTMEIVTRVATAGSSMPKTEAAAAQLDLVRQLPYNEQVAALPGMIDAAFQAADEQFDRIADPIARAAARNRGVAIPEFARETFNKKVLNESRQALRGTEAVLRAGKGTGFGVGKTTQQFQDEVAERAAQEGINARDAALKMVDDQDAAAKETDDKWEAMAQAYEAVGQADFAWLARQNETRVRNQRVREEINNAYANLPDLPSASLPDADRNAINIIEGAALKREGQTKILAAQISRDPTASAALKVRDAEARHADLVAKRLHGGAKDEDVDAAYADIIAARLDEADSLFDLAQLRRNRDVLLAHGDPVKENEARIRIVEASLAKARADNNKPGIEQGEQDLIALADEAQKSQLDIIRSRMAIGDALTERNPVESAQRALDRARFEEEHAIGEAAKGDAAAARIRAEHGVEDAMSSLIESRTNLLIAVAEASGDTVEVARLGAIEAKRKLDQAISENQGEAAVNQATGEWKKANENYARSSRSHEESLIDFQLSMGQITTQTAIEGLRLILSRTREGTDEYMQLALKIHQLEQQAGQDLQFNLPTTLGLPTLYEARRVSQSTAAGIGYQDNRNVNLLVQVNGAQDPMTVTNQVVNALQSAMGGGPTLTPQIGMGA